jgi:hypothetical protein
VARVAYRLIPVRVPTGNTNGNTADINRGLVPGVDVSAGCGDYLSADDKD